MTRSESIAKLTEALLKVQGAMTSVGRDKTARVKMKAGGEYSYSYFDLASVWDAIRPLLAANGLAVIQCPEPEGNKVTVETTLSHVSGEWMSSRLTMMATDATPQAIGSAITYARRYGLCPMLGVVADEDDDGQAAQPKRPSAPKAQPQRPPPPSPAQPKPEQAPKASGPLRTPPAGSPAPLDQANAKVAEAQTLDALRVLKDPTLATLPKEDHPAFLRTYNARGQALAKAAA